MTKMLYVGREIENMESKNLSCRRISVPKVSPQQVGKWRSVFRFLNEKDRDILYLTFVSQKKQKAVQRILQRSQPSLCYDIKRIRSRIKFINYLNSVIDIFVDFVLDKDEDFDSQMISVMVLMFYTTSYTHSSDVMGIPQIKVRYIFNRALDKLEEKGMWDIFEIMDNIRFNKNIVKRIYTPYDENRGKIEDVFLPF